MVKMNFKNLTLEKIIRRFKWARNNSIEIFEKSQKEGILDYHFKSKKFKFQPLAFEFQCLITSTDAYIRMFTNDENQNFGVLVEDGFEIKKRDIRVSEIKNLLKNQIVQLENIFKNFEAQEFDNEIGNILAIINHEYLHQGEMILMLREAGVDLPERFKKSFAL